MTTKVPPAKPWWKEKDLWIVLAIAWAARAAFLYVMPATVYSDDVNSWLIQWHAMQEDKFLLAPGLSLPYPPLWIQFIFALGKLSTFTGLSFVLLLRVLLIALESGVIVASWRLAGTLAPGAKRLALFLAGVSLNPIAILLVCQHGQFDTLMMLWVVLMLLSFVRFSRSGDALDWLAGCFFLGLAILTKTVPLILAPIALHGARKLPWKTLFFGAALALGPVAFATGAVYVYSPEATRGAGGFRGMPGWFGVTGILLMLEDFDAIRAWQSAYPFAALAAVAGLSLAFWMRWRIAESGLVLLALILLVSVPLWGPGYSPQYIYWLIPLAVVCYPCLGGGWRRTAVAAYVVGALTTVWEYAILPSHGMFLVWLMPRSEALRDVVLTWRDQAHQTLSRLPWFFALIGLFAHSILVLRRLRPEAVPAAPPPARAKK